MALGNCVVRPACLFNGSFFSELLSSSIEFALLNKRANKIALHKFLHSFSSMRTRGKKLRCSPKSIMQSLNMLPMIYGGRSLIMEYNRKTIPLKRSFQRTTIRGNLFQFFTPLVTCTVGIKVHHLVHRISPEELVELLRQTLLLFRVICPEFLDDVQLSSKVFFSAQQSWKRTPLGRIPHTAVHGGHNVVNTWL